MALRDELIAAVLKDEQAFERVLAALRAAYTRAWSLGHQQAVKRLLDEVQAVGARAFTQEMEARVLAAFEREVGPQAMRRMLEGPVANLGEAAWRLGAEEAAREAGVDYRFGLRDREALALARRGDLYWVANHWDAFTRERLARAVARFFEEGQTYERLAQWMREAMGGVHDAGTTYWELAADTAATKTRELGRIAGYEQAGVRWVQVRAHLDERTTPLCRSLHGRLIPLATVQRQRDAYLEAAGRGNLEAARAAWPMWEATAGFGRELPQNVALPPYHFRCRTITVAYLGKPPEALVEEGEDVERWRLLTLQREPVGRRDLEAIVERARLARWERGNLERHLKHARAAGGVGNYNQQAFDLIRRAGREIALAMANGQLMGLFFEPYKGERVRVAVVNLERPSIVTLHIRRGLENPRVYEVQPIVQPGGRKIAKRRLLSW